MYNWYVMHGMIDDLLSYSRDMQSYYEEFLWHKIFVNFMNKKISKTKYMYMYAS